VNFDFRAFSYMGNTNQTRGSNGTLNAALAVVSGSARFSAQITSAGQAS
jgi:hypothetical protein